MVAETPKLVYCPRCKKRGVSTVLGKAAPTSFHYHQKGAPSIVSLWGLNILTCEEVVGEHGSGLKCGYQLVLDQRLDNHT